MLRLPVIPGLTTPLAQIAQFDKVSISKIVTDAATAAGSIRVPAANNGLFGLRPSHGATSLEGVYRLSRFVLQAGQNISKFV